MAFSDWTADPNWVPVILAEIELGHRIDTDTWTQADAPNTACYYIDHSTEGEPARVEANGTALTERATLALCQANASSWYYDAATGRLYLHVADGGDPGDGTYVVLSYIWEYLCSKQFEAPNEIVFNSRWYLPYLDETQLPDIDFSVSFFDSDKSLLSIGNIVLLNADGYFDSRLASYIYEGKKLVYRVGAKGAPYEDYEAITVKTGAVEWTDTQVTIEVMDTRK